MMVLSETSQLESVTGLLRNVLNNGAGIARINNFLRASSDEERASLRPGMQQALKSLAEDFPLLKDVGLIGPDGIVVGHTNTQKGKGMDLGERPYFTASMQGKSSVQNTRSKTTGQVTTILSAPVMNGTKALGVIYATLDLKSLSAETTDSIKIGKTGACFVYDGSGLLLMHPNKDYIGDEDGKLDWVRQILAQGSGRLVYGWGGKEKVAYFRSIPAMNWFVLVSVERAEVLAPAKTLLRSNSLISGGIALLVGLIIFLVARNIAGACGKARTLWAGWPRDILRLTTRNAAAWKRARPGRTKSAAWPGAWGPWWKTSSNSSRTASRRRGRPMRLLKRPVRPCARPRRPAKPPRARAAKAC